ncbi:Hermansky-Pudlak syndrome 5 protein isoform X2 [Erpetoichthys calabaricus]|uniref:Hermansky-Pudlak syndrome 5 protein isoform X2 n=1 Tax=Erpetoichthys calabaricus TaxID=27687 RepID=UPI0022343A7E|nr:Hermansky-Pudlak syndrome 5 protein isoform X2 [Erpetoichthys calabaricus]
MSSVEVIPDCYTHVLAEFDSLDPLLSALRLDHSRLKCTSVAVSRKWLALGSSAGGLHLIQKEGWKQKLILTHKEGSVSKVACCLHDEDFVAVATSQGLVVIWELHVDHRGKPERVCVSSEHRGREVTALCWDSTQHRLFIGDSTGKVSVARVASTKFGKGAGFVMFPVQAIATVDSRVVQLSYFEGRLLVSSLNRCYLCDTDKEKFWRIGNKERDGEYGACFFPLAKNSTSPSPLIYCARPGSRMWEVNIEGDVLSTHQFKKLLASPPLPVISNRSDPVYSKTTCFPQSIAFPKLLLVSDQYLLTWTEKGIYIFIPQCVQVLLWSEVKVLDIAVYRNELFCLHFDGHISHLYLLSVERCVERLLRMDSWVLAAAVCSLFCHVISSGKARKVLPLDRLEHLKNQLDVNCHSDLIGQLEELILKIEPLDSASSSRRSSISSHGSFNVLDSGIYRVISRRGSQSDEDACSMVSQTFSEDERLKEFSSAHEEEQETPSLPSDRPDTERCESLLQFQIPLPFRPTPPLINLQAVKDSVSSFMKKTTEKINTLQMPSDLWLKLEGKDGSQQADLLVSLNAESAEQDKKCLDVTVEEEEEDCFKELRESTDHAKALLEDPIVLLNTHDLMCVLKAWLPVLVKTFGSLKNHINIKNIRDLKHESSMQEGIKRIEDVKVEKTIEVDSESISFAEQNNTCTEKKKRQESANLILNKDDVKDYNHLNGERDSQQAYDVTLVPQKDITENKGETEMYEDQISMKNEHSKTNLDTLDEKNTSIECVHNTVDTKEYTWEQVQISPPPDLSSELHQDLTELATLCFEMSCFQSEEHGSHCTSETGDEAVMACSFLQQYFFLLDLERVRRCCLIHYRDYPVVWDTYITGLKALTLSCQETTFLGERNLLKSLKCLRDSALCSTPFLLAHLTRLYEMYGELAIRSFGQFYPTVLPADVLAMSRNHPAHFLAYLDNLIKSKPEEERAPLLSSFLQPECLRHEWLELALSHDAPQLADTINPLGNPRSRSHLFPWGYGQLLKLLIKLPGSLSDKEKIAESCKSHGFWTGYLWTCLDLGRKKDVFSAIVRLDDISLFEELNGALPETVDEWKCILQIAKHKAEEPESPNGSEKVNGVVDWSSRTSLENMILLLARTTGPERAFEILQECGLNIELSERSALVCEFLKVAEKRQRALLQSMLERCDRFLWSQQA